mgnify:CR=1 FL=1
MWVRVSIPLAHIPACFDFEITVNSLSCSVLPCHAFNEVHCIPALSSPPLPALLAQALGLMEAHAVLATLLGRV